ncbi:MAG: hypothetical protein N5P05_004690 (plasmid) [Chroococcopsis gigantea SAG 12.99]|jgi:hypothetical protein|nr:hypothetical protein [Chroococcopsis gigantea SAG 12.99]
MFPIFARFLNESGDDLNLVDVKQRKTKQKKVLLAIRAIALLLIVLMNF